MLPHCCAVVKGARTPGIQRSIPEVSRAPALAVLSPGDPASRGKGVWGKQERGCAGSGGSIGEIVKLRLIFRAPSWTGISAKGVGVRNSPTLPHTTQTYLRPLPPVAQGCLGALTPRTVSDSHQGPPISVGIESA